MFMPPGGGGVLQKDFPVVEITMSGDQTHGYMLEPKLDLHAAPLSKHAAINTENDDPGGIMRCAACTQAPD